MNKTYILVYGNGEISDVTYDSVTAALKDAKDTISHLDEYIYICEAVPLKKVSLATIEESV